MRSPRTPFEPVATRRVGPGVEFGALAIPIRIVCVSGNYPERVELSGARARLRFSSLRARPNTTGDSFDRDDRLLRIDDHDRRARACDDDEWTPTCATSRTKTTTTWSDDFTRFLD